MYIYIYKYCIFNEFHTSPTGNPRWEGIEPSTNGDFIGFNEPMGCN
jgi:hypothetical protein